MRIGIISSNSHVIPHGGAGIFIKEIKRQAYDDCVVDLILDQPLTEQEFVSSMNLGGEVLSPKSPLSYSKHRNTFSFDDSINFERMVNFREAIFAAISTRVYDLLIINSIDALPAIVGLGIQKYIRVILYTHVEFMVGMMDKKDTPFSDQFIWFHDKLADAEGLVLGTQTPMNEERVKSLRPNSNTRFLPLPIPDLDIIKTTEITDNRKGILFSGRWEPRKRPVEYIALLVETGLPAKVLTGQRSVSKFEAEFKRHGITDYEIRAGIHGKEKYDFISSCSMCYHPSLKETFSYSAIEALCFMPVLVDGEAYWHDNLESLGLRLVKTNKRTRKDLALSVLDCDQKDVVLDYAEKMSLWNHVQPISPGTSERNSFSKKDNFLYNAHMGSLGRPVSIEDICTAYNSLGLYIPHHLPYTTYLSKTGDKYTGNNETAVSLDLFT